MITKIFRVEDEHDVQIQLAANILKNGGTVAFPTETVYGLGANALDEAAIYRIYEAKGRPSDNPLIVHVANQSDLIALVKNISQKAYKMMDKFWPGPLTMIFDGTSKVAENVTPGLQTLAVRIPSHSIARKLIELSGIPIAAPSANRSGRPSPTSGEHVIEDLDGRVNAIVIGLDSEFGLESTILDMTCEPPMLLRPGSVTVEEIEATIGLIQIDPGLEKKLSDDIKPKAPGMKYTHYSPDADVKIILGHYADVVTKINTLVDFYHNKKVGIMCCDETKFLYAKGTIISLGSKTNLDEIASNLFKTLRQFDDLGVDIVLAEGYDTIGMGKAIMNRLNKAAGYEIIQV